MTTFEIIIIVLLSAIVVLLAWHFLLTRNNYSLNQTKELKRQQDFERLFLKIGSMELLAVDSRRILKELTDIVDKMHRNLCVEIDWDELSKEQQDEFLKRLIMPNYDSPFQPPFNPTCETTNKED